MIHKCTGLGIVVILLEHNAQADKEVKVFPQKNEDDNNDRKIDGADADVDAANAGPDRGDENDIEDKAREDDDADADAIADNAGMNQIDKPKVAVGDQDLKFTNEVSFLWCKR